MPKEFPKKSPKQYLKKLQIKLSEKLTKASQRSGRIADNVCKYLLEKFSKKLLNVTKKTMCQQSKCKTTLTFERKGFFLSEISLRNSFGIFPRISSKSFRKVHKILWKFLRGAYWFFARNLSKTSPKMHFQTIFLGCFSCS